MRIARYVYGVIIKYRSYLDVFVLLGDLEMCDSTAIFMRIARMWLGCIVVLIADCFADHCQRKYSNFVDLSSDYESIGGLLRFLFRDCAVLRLDFVSIAT
jgi:hypothetical protein